MAIFSKSIEQAQAAVTKAAGVVTDWENKAANARAQAANLEAESGAAILEDETAAERITLDIQSWERKARAYDQAAGEARRKHGITYRAALEVEAREEEKLAAAAAKASTAHEGKVKALLGELKDLDEVDYAAVGVYVGTSGKNYAVSRGEVLQAEARKHEIRAALIRYFLATGTVTQDVHDLNSTLGTSITDNNRTIGNEGIEIPESLRAARDAGVSVVGA